MTGVEIFDPQEGEATRMVTALNRGVVGASLALMTVWLIGCAGAVDEAEDCAEGTLVAGEQANWCLHQQSIIVETGFECPVDQPYRFEVDGLTVCSDNPRPPDPADLPSLPGDPPPSDTSAAPAPDAGTDAGTDAAAEQPPATGSGDGAAAPASGQTEPDTAGGATEPSSDEAEEPADDATSEVDEAESDDDLVSESEVEEESTEVDEPDEAD